MLSVEALEERNRALREHVSQLEAMVGLSESRALVAALTHKTEVANPSLMSEEHNQQFSNYEAVNSPHANQFTQDNNQSRDQNGPHYMDTHNTSILVIE